MVFVNYFDCIFSFCLPATARIHTVSTEWEKCMLNAVFTSVLIFLIQFLILMLLF